MYTAVARRCTRSVHAVNGRVDGHIQATYTAVHTGRKHGRLHGRKHGVYTVCTRPYAGHAHGPSVSRTRPCTQQVRGKTRPGTRPVPDRVVRTVYMAVHRVHGRVCTMYTAVHGPSMTRTRPCTLSCTLYTAVFTPRVRYTARKRPCTADGHGRVYGPCTRPCTVYMYVFVACVYGRPRPCTDCVRAMYTVCS